MKYLDNPALQRIGQWMEGVDIGQLVVSGRIEAYTCKLTDSDRRLSKSLEKELQQYQLQKFGSGDVVNTSTVYGMSPPGSPHPMTGEISKKTLLHLVQTLSHSHPDNDLTNVRMSNFWRGDKAHLVDIIENRLLDVAQIWDQQLVSGQETFFNTLWQSIDQVIDSDYSEVYFYSDSQGIEQLGGPIAVWSIHAFIYNRALKKMLYFMARACNKSAVQDSNMGGMGYGYPADVEFDDEEEYVAGEMEVSQGTPLADDQEYSVNTHLPPSLFV